MKTCARSSRISNPFAIILLALAAGWWPVRAEATPRSGGPTYFAGNPATRQLAFRYRVGARVLGWTPDGTGIYGLFRQSSFWHLDDQDRGYTVESNYAPEVLVFADGARLGQAVAWWPGRLGLSLSYSHHSNGIDGALSRSWNHFNGGLYLGDPTRDAISAAVTGWYPFNVESNNPDIASYAGHGCITLDLRPSRPLPILGRSQLYLASNFSFNSPGGGVLTNLETSLSFAPGWLGRSPFPTPAAGRGDNQPETAVGLFVQWVVGRGESLIAYRRYQNTVRFGLRLW